MTISPCAGPWSPTALLSSRQAVPKTFRSGNSAVTALLTGKGGGQTLRL